MISSAIGYPKPLMPCIEGDIHGYCNIVNTLRQLVSVRIIFKHPARNHEGWCKGSHAVHGNSRSDYSHTAHRLHSINRYIFFRPAIKFILRRCHIYPRPISANGTSLHLQSPKIFLRHIAHDAEARDRLQLAEIKTHKTLQFILCDERILIGRADRLLKCMLNIECLAAKDLAVQFLISIRRSGPLNGPKITFRIHFKLTSTYQRDIKIRKLEVLERQHLHTCIISHIDAFALIIKGQSSDGKNLLRELDAAFL